MSLSLILLPLLAQVGPGPALPQAPLEVIESLEQLRVLWHGHRIAVVVTQHAPGPGVDTPEDLVRVRALFAQG